MLVFLFCVLSMASTTNGLFIGLGTAAIGTALAAVYAAYTPQTRSRYPPMPPDTDSVSSQSSFTTVYADGMFREALQATEQHSHSPPASDTI
jgi:hypothetical protein